MKTQLFNIIEHQKTAAFDKLQTNLSFNHFIKHLEKLVSEGEQGKHELFQFVVERFVEAKKKHGPIQETNLADYQTELYYTYNLLVPTLHNENQTLWALALPLGKKIFYGTDAFYSLLTQNSCEDQIRLKVTGKNDDHEKTILQSIYALILDRLYHIPLFESDSIVCAYINNDTGLPQYFAITIDNTFVTVKAKNKLPPLNYAALRQNKMQVDWGIMLEILPLKHFEFEGFSIITLSDITLDHVTENIKNIIINSSDNNFASNYEVLQESLKILMGNPHIKFGISPLLQVNGKPLIDHAFMYGSVLSDLLQSKEDLHNQEKITEEYLKNPQNLVYNIGAEIENSDFEFLGDLSDLGITSYVCMPLFYNNNVTGILEIYTEDGHTFDKTSIAKLRRTSALLAQLLYDQANYFNAKIETIIKEKFTSLQPAVQWKFNEVALEYLRKVKPDQPKPIIENIQFKDVFPLYGAVDIRNSTIERNKALIADYRLQLNFLLKVLAEIKHIFSLAIIDEVNFNCVQWLERLDITPVDSLQLKLNEFLEKDVPLVLDHFKRGNAGLTTLINDYENETIIETGLFHSHRRSLEASMATINTAVNGYLDLLNLEIQQSYPCYFEKFRTDGVEYDIYIGQSIAPDKPFNSLYVKNVRLWQLSSMAAIAKITNSLLTQMETPLETTQLIFVNSNEIDISFRVDEKRFDVEGSYNIRYHIIKKRIDKIHIKNTNERLTQPGKIALVYYDNKEKAAYLNYISYLQNKQILLTDLEELELEELQGISGLKAMRIGVKF
ncbi:GAF domain-containing protein [Olivibacter sp. SDN3]|uniref:GAF domain-containing protein n=1 Tax=Olivibacter sp. SDN3 TaxID=2764720 RepID=UPI001650FE0B|nr:GAF domain-containing protein [Olivibacter sp. SDN3]QNL50505.1 GAF domain-containing protein [Olivibacter sp. SDN3]